MEVQIVISEKTGAEYKVYNGTAYNKNTSNDVIKVLDMYLQGSRDQRVRIFYGDTKTGQDWNEEHDVIGYLGRSCGQFKIPLMISKANSSGGAAILDHCIIKITVEKRTVYKHPKYNCNEFDIKKIGKREEILFSRGYRFKVMRNGRENVANFKEEDAASRYVSFMKGERNKVA